MCRRRASSDVRCLVSGVNPGQQIEQDARRSGSRSGEWVRYLAPKYGGVHARLLPLFRDPGPKTQRRSGTGMLCVENPAGTANRYLNLLNSTAIDVETRFRGTHTHGISTANRPSTTWTEVSLHSRS